MKIKFKGKKSIVTKSVEQYLETKLEKIDKYFQGKDLEAFVNIEIKNLDQSIEVSIPTKYFTIRAEERSKDLYSSIDMVIDKLERQIRKNKTKIKQKYNQITDFELNMDFESDEEEDVVIVKRKNMNSKPMDEEEAILQMQLLNHDFFVFKNTIEECVSVIYKRKDNKFGIINIK